MLAREMLSEPVVVDDIYVSDLGGIEDAGEGLIRFTFCAKQASIYGGDEFIVRIRIVAGPRLVLHTIKAAMNYLGTGCCGAMRKLMH